MDHGSDVNRYSRPGTHWMCIYFVIMTYVLVALLLFRGNAFWLTTAQAYWGIAILRSFKRPFGYTAFIWKTEIVLDSSFRKLPLTFYSFTSKAVPLPVMGEARWRPRKGQPVQQCAAHSALVRLKPLSQACRDTLFLIITVAAEKWLLSVITLTFTQLDTVYILFIEHWKTVSHRKNSVSHWP